MTAAAKGEKFCATCGRRMTPRRRWRDSWPAVRYCTVRCRRRLTATDYALEEAIVALLGESLGRKMLCPSQAARRAGGERWRTLMERAREAARRLAVAGVLEFVQRGQPVDPSTARGPVRLRRVATSLFGWRMALDHATRVNRAPDSGFTALAVKVPA